MHNRENIAPRNLRSRPPGNSLSLYEPRLKDEFSISNIPYSNHSKTKSPKPIPQKTKAFQSLNNILHESNTPSTNLLVKSSPSSDICPSFKSYSPISKPSEERITKSKSNSPNNMSPKTKTKNSKSPDSIKSKAYKSQNSYLSNLASPQSNDTLVNTKNGPTENKIDDFNMEKKYGDIGNITNHDEIKNIDKTNESNSIEKSFIDELFENRPIKRKFNSPAQIEEKIIETKKVENKVDLDQELLEDLFHQFDKCFEENDMLFVKLSLLNKKIAKLNHTSYGKLQMNHLIMFLQIRYAIEEHRKYATNCFQKYFD